MELENKMLKSWIDLSGIMNKNKFTKFLTYNESIIMLFVYEEYEKGKKAISVKKIIEKTKINKSLVNRVVKSLKEKELVEDKIIKGDGRLSYISLVENNKEKFLKIHKETMIIINEIIKIIGIENAKSFMDSVNKLKDKNFNLKNKEKNVKKI